MLRPHVVEVDPAGGQERSMGEGTAAPGQVRARWVSHSCIRWPQVPMGTQHDRGLPVTRISLRLTVLTRLVLGLV
jgi:hypothetical protein